MWIYNDDYKKWESKKSDSISKYDFDLLKQELRSTRLYSRCLSGATYLPINNMNNIYDVLDNYKKTNWYISPDPTNGSIYSSSIMPLDPMPINKDSINDYFKYRSEYGLTLKNLFTPYKLIKDSSKNYYEVDLATTGQLDLNDLPTDLKIDGVKVLNGHKVLVKNQKTEVSLPSTTDPDTYFISNYTIKRVLGGIIEYEYSNEENGIYIYDGSKLIREDDLDDYENSMRYSAVPKLGDLNKNKQFHLSRLLNKYFPTTVLNQPIEFTEKHNWILRNRVDYNNLYETNYYDIIKNDIEIYEYEGVTYSIPERTLSVGEFGVILVYQEDYSNIIENKYKVNLRSISQTSKYYWICGDDNTLLQVRKHDFEIVRIDLDSVKSNLPNKIKSNLKSVSFYNDMNGVVVGEFNTIYHTKTGGKYWEKIEIDKFIGYNYNKVLFRNNSTFYVGGNTGIFIEFINNISGWVAHKRRISQIEDEYDEYLLVENINDLLLTTVNWNVQYNSDYYSSMINPNMELLFIITNNNKLIAYDINKTFKEIESDFIYFDLNGSFKDIRNIINNNNEFYISSSNNSNDYIFRFNINDFNEIVTESKYSNTTIITNPVTSYKQIYLNNIFNYNNNELLICGNNALLEIDDYSGNFNPIDPNFVSRLKSSMLFLDYDIASKLNWFTDDGDYRLPNSITFSSVNSMEFKSIFHPTTSTVNSYTEVSWIDYYKDSLFTFEYYNPLGMDESVKVEINSKFEYYGSTVSVSLNNANITSNINDIKLLAPNIEDNDIYKDSIVNISFPTSSYELFVHNKIIILKLNSTLPVDIGDVFSFESNIVDTNLIVNKIVSNSGYNYIYFYSNFNDNIITELTLLSSVVITNLNKFNVLESAFNKHPLSIGYSLNYDGNIYELSANFNNETAYYNLQTNVLIDSSTKSMLYTDSFLNFGYSPTYNILDYLTKINDLNDPNPDFYETKEFLVMPIYENIPLSSLPSDDSIYINYSGLTYGLTHSMADNKIYFGENLKFEWETFFENTFIDVKIDNNLSERMLILDKYYDDKLNQYILSLNKRINWNIGIPTNGLTIDIKSRRSLKEISDDLQLLNNIHRTKRDNFKDEYLGNSKPDYQSFQNELNFKISTDSYSKILLSDSSIIRKLSSIIYVDYKNELAMNVTRLSKEYKIPILNTINFGGRLYITCSEPHDLKTGDGVILEFNGGLGSSEELNPQYNGYHVITKINDNDFYLDNVVFGSPALVGIDPGYVKYIKQDPFFNYQPIDLIDLGVDAKGKIAIELNEDNLSLNGNIYSLENIDYNKLRFKLIDGLNLETINVSYSWLLEAEVSNALIGLRDGNIVWYRGTWLGGRWFEGTWESGVWMSGDWYDGTWNSHIVSDNKLTASVDEKTIDDHEQSIWYSGRWFNGTWTSGIWDTGRWYGGNWKNGYWYDGIWNDGIWENGNFQGGIWVLGEWMNGIFNCNREPSYWLNGKWLGGDFENGMWYNGYWEQKNGLSRFGTKSYNSRTANWISGTWVSGSFYSYLNMNDNNELDVSDVHKYSIWKTGKWLSGEWYGGIAYNMDFKTGTWYGGILEEIQLIGFGGTNNTNSYFLLNGKFDFNIGDSIYVIDNNTMPPPPPPLGINKEPGEYRIIDVIEDSNGNTKLYVDADFSSVFTSNITNLRIVSKFANVNWKSGIWTNGLFENGLWEGGIWYNGVFKGIWN
jgi:hypothetical protein